MDLGAYAQIDELKNIVENNGIVVPRLRGYRLMKNEEPVSAEEIKRMIKNCEVDICEQLCRSDPFWKANSNCCTYSSWTDYLCEYYLVKTTNEDGYTKYTNIRWDRIHGRKRKILKFEIKKQKRRIQKQFDMWNKYAGKENILYIHSRIGGGNWNYYGGNELVKMSWFLDSVDDCYDGTYCDIYASIE